jgi:hypothetical protein
MQREMVMEFPTAINVIKPDVRDGKQLDDGIDDTFVSRWGGEVRSLLIDFQAHNIFFCGGNGIPVWTMLQQCCFDHWLGASAGAAQELDASTRCRLWGDRRNSAT